MIDEKMLLRVVHCLNNVCKSNALYLWKHQEVMEDILNELLGKGFKRISKNEIDNKVKEIYNGR